MSAQETVEYIRDKFLNTSLYGDDPLTRGAIKDLLAVVDELTAAPSPAPGAEQVERFQFPDGSAIVIRVTGPDPQANDQAGKAYREHLYRPLLDLEKRVAG